MTVERALQALRERWALVVLCVLLGLLGAGAATYLVPRQYAADVTLYVALQGQATTPEDAYEANELAKERALSYAPLLTDERITQPVIDRLGLTMTTGQLEEAITVTVEPETTVISAAVRAGTPQQAADIANALAAEFGGLVEQLEQPIGEPPAPPPPGQPAPSAVEPARIGIQTIRNATPVDTPVSPDVPFNLALGAALGLVVGVGGVLVRAARDRSVRSGEVLQELTQVPVLAEVPHDRRAATRPLLVDDPYSSPRAEAFRRLRTSLQFLGGARGRGVLVVTSPRIGEGTSTTAVNLAITLAEAGNRVLLVDANLRDPGVADYLGSDSVPGLADVLAGRMVWPYARQPWSRGGFDVLPAGSTAHDHSQLLSSFGLADLFDDLRGHYHFIVVDTPALLPVSDAAAVAARADGVVLVVQHGQTTQDQVDAALASLRAVSARLLGTVLTMRKGRTVRDTRGQAYRTPSPPRHETPMAPPPNEMSSPPVGIPRAALPEQATTNGTRPEDDDEAAPRPADGEPAQDRRANRRGGRKQPSPKPRSSVSAKPHS
ncbi:MAG TPA: polysaccharide biosynthesis tyrosine autokinase [Pseudonocardia sp.]|mgnify:CR=1 FL=1|uniref:polysaccharide biosynthesis tyrosine autokinase n=1 Tax=Pseudonocardia sp. TaxID=60912 RepID=UPI002B4B669E|nr:polysaccharide biosynthesis tyrosine autokinase [Pseudonocardia sp.]HLU58258.1 polysaccharide biosynthesis tyrosine autokinase [Pseudonocardia sp.]